MIKSFIKDSTIYAIPYIVSRGLAVILIPLYTRVLSPADFGSFDLLIVFANLVNLTVALEVSQGLARYYSNEKDAERRIAYASSAFWFTVFCYALFLGIALIANEKLSHFVMGREKMEAPFRIGVIYIFINGIFYLIQNQFRWEFRSQHYAVVSMIVTIVTAIFAILLTYFLGWGLEGFLLGMTVGVLLGCIYGLWHLKNSFRFQFHWCLLKEMIVFSTPLVPSGIAVFITLYIDRIMINHFLTLSDVGLFGIGYRVASIAVVFIIGFQGALTPFIYSNYQLEETPKNMEVIFRVFVAFSLVIFFVISLFSTEIIKLISTPLFYSASTVVVFLIPAILLSNMYIFAPGITIAKKTHLILYINILGGLLNVLLNFLLLPKFGIQGAAVSTFLSYLIVFFIYMRFSQKFYYVPHKWQPIVFRAFIIFVIIFILSKLESPLLTSLALKLSSIIFIIFILQGLIKPSETQQVIAGLRNIYKRLSK